MYSLAHVGPAAQNAENVHANCYRAYSLVIKGSVKISSHTPNPRRSYPRVPTRMDQVYRPLGSGDLRVIESIVIQVAVDLLLYGGCGILLSP